jgi:hypothetical protein
MEGAPPCRKPGSRRAVPSEASASERYAVAVDR